ncbi:F-box associated domain, type 3 [Dillenia turbinata]|uniref:F-box associated domain, type 3 n=1 Tax=Dillenia turbinata TaxID=194707 RepID=A0AAN8VCX0_9MAGN
MFADKKGQRKIRITAKCIPNDIVMDILSGLHAKTLSNFRCVSKSWCNLISDPYFINLHRRRSHGQKPLLLVSYYDKSHLQMTCYSYPNEKPPSVHNQCEFQVDGEIVNIHSSPKGSLACYCDNGIVHVCNPSTREHLALPKGSSANAWPPILGFAYLPLTNEYKVVHLFFVQGGREVLFDDFEIRCEILTLNHKANPESLSWKLVNGKCPYPVHEWNHPAFANEALHWTLNPVYVSLYERGRPLIVSFDVRNEEFGVIEGPESCSWSDSLNSCVVELQGSLAFVASCWYEKFRFGVWVMRDYNHRLWSKEFTINMKRIDYFGDFNYLHDFLPIPKDMRNEDGEILLECRHKQYWYNIETESFTPVLLPAKHNKKCKFNLYWDSFFSLGDNSSLAANLDPTL